MWVDPGRRLGPHFVRSRKPNHMLKRENQGIALNCDSPRRE
jgi:hypothetical protein